MSKLVFTFLLLTVNFLFAQTPDNASIKNFFNFIEEEKIYSDLGYDGREYDSLNMRFVGNWPFGYCDAVIYDSVRNIGIVGSGGGVYLFDLTDPAQPTKISEIRTRSRVLDFDYTCGSNVLYIANYWEGLSIWDLADPSTPQKLSSYIGTRTYNVTVSGQHAYVRVMDSILILDVSDPSNPAYVSAYCPAYGPNSVYVKWPYAYVGFHNYPTNGALEIVDVSDPSNPTKISDISLAPGYVEDIYVDDTRDYVYIADNGAFAVIDVQDPYNPIWVDTCFTYDGNFGVFAQGNYAYVADGSYGLTIIDITDPTNTYIIGSLPTNRWTGEIWVSDNYAYMNETEQGFIIIDVSDPSAPLLVAEVELPGIFDDVKVSGSYVYLAGGPKGLYIIDVSDPTYPIETGHINPSGAIWIEAVDFVGDYVYLADYDGLSLRVIDVTDPQNPQEVGRCVTGSAMDLYVDFPFVYVADYNQGLDIVEVSDPTNPILTGSCQTLGEPWGGVNVVDPFAYLALNHYGMAVIDISDPSSPQVTGYYHNEAFTYDVDVRFPYAYLGYNSFIHVIDVTDPTNPVYAGHCNTRYEPQKIHIVYPYLYVAEGYGMIEMFDISDPTNPILVGYHCPAHETNSIYTDPPYVFTIAKSRCALQIYKNLLIGVEEKPKENLSGLKIPGFVYGNLLKLSGINKNFDVKIFDILGREVLHQHIIPQKSYIRLNNLTSGVYFIHLKDQKPKLHKFVLIR